MARTVATAYTGANVSLTIGSALVTNAFGISWEVSQNKRPIYGYNSLYYDGIASGQVIVLGQLYINYQHPQYLSHILAKYYNNIDYAFRQRDAEEQTSKDASKLISLLKRYDGMGEHPGDAEIIENIFNNPKLQSQMVSNLSGGSVVNVRSSDNLGGALPLTLANSGGLYGDLSERNLNRESRRALDEVSNYDPSNTAALHRPDLFSGAGGVSEPLNIVITYGDPNITSMSGGITSYMNSSTVILRDVHFIGEAQQVMSDDQPIMETYKFMARSKEVLVNRTEETADEKTRRYNETVAQATSSVSNAIAAAELADKAAFEAAKAAKGAAASKPEQPRRPSKAPVIVAPDLPPEVKPPK